MKQLRLTMTIALFAMLFGFSQSKSQEFEFFADYDSFESSLYALWFYDDIDDINDYKLYLAEGTYDEFDSEKFDEVATFTQSDVLEENGIFFYILPIDLEEGDYTAVLQINKDDETLYTIPSRFYAGDDNWGRPEIQFLNFPSTFEAFVGVTYEFDFDAEYVDDPNKEIVYSLSKYWEDELDENMQIDAETGLFTFTPETKGSYVLGIRASLAEDEEIFEEYYFDFSVRGCENPSLVSGNIKDQLGNPVDNGFVRFVDVRLFEFGEEDEWRDPIAFQEYAARVANGQYSLNIDAGDYYMVYSDDLNLQTWYLDADSWEDADEINVSCGNEYSFDMNVQLVEYEKYIVSGKITTEDNDFPNETTIIFLGYNSIDDSNPVYQAETYSNENGEYSIELPDLFTFKALAFSWGKRNFFAEYPLYYNQTMNFEEAEWIKITGDLTGIDFDFTSIPGLEYYTVTGTVSNEDGEVIEDAYVMFNGYNTLDWYMYEYWDYAITDENGNYSIELPTNYEFIAMAVNYDEIGRGIPLFYNQTYNRDEAEIFMLSEDKTGVDFQFEALEDKFNGSISGTVKDQNDNSLSNVYLEAYLLETDDDARYLFNSRFSISSNDGTYNINKLLPGKYIIFAYSESDGANPGFYVEGDIATLEWDQATLVEVLDDSETSNINVTLEVPEGGIIIEDANSGRANGRVVAKNNESNSETAITGAVVSVHTNSGEVISANQSKNDGKFMLNSLPEGSYTLKVDKVGFEEVFRNFSVSKSNMTDIGTISLTPVPASVEDVIAGRDMIEAYPNPAIESTTITFQANSDQSVITITDLNGQELFNTTIDTQNGLNNYNLNLNNYNSGVYYINVRTGNQNLVSPLVITK